MSDHKDGHAALLLANEIFLALESIRKGGQQVASTKPSARPQLRRMIAFPMEDDDAMRMNDSEPS